MQELDFINTHLGGHAITIQGLQELISNNPLQQPLQVVEIGCGGGDNLRAIKKWADRKQQPMTLTGIDINKECIEHAMAHRGNQGISFILSDYRQARLSSKPDVIFSSLFCHHFTNDELIAQLQWMKANSNTGFFINDLHRHPLAYGSIKLLTSAFSKSRLVKNDAPLSVLRGFKRNDWKRLFASAGIHTYTIQWRWAFRWLVTYRHDAIR